MTTGEDRNKDRFKNWQLFESSRFIQSDKAHAELRLLNQSAYHFLVPPSVTREYHPKVLERYLLQCIVAHLECTLGVYTGF